jgi:REP element-mobilizing transposase RayT
MPKLEYKFFYKRNLPHIQPPDAFLFVTYRLVGSIPGTVMKELLILKEQSERAIAAIDDPEERERRIDLEQRRLFGKWDSVLDRGGFGPQWLGDGRIAQEIVDSLHFLDGQVLALDTYSILSNHVHVIFKPLFDEKSDDYFAISSIMHAHKRYSARQANRILKRTGQFWQHESYDHFVRDERELERIRRYVINNPVRAGLAERWEDWAWTYCGWL